MTAGKWFDYYSPTKISFEAGSASRLGELISRLGTRFLILNLRKDNQNPAGLAAISESISNRSDGCIIYDEIIGNPDTEQVDTATYFARRSHVDCIVAYGGIGSIDAGKAVSLLANNSFFAEDLFTVAPNEIQPALPLVTIPVEPCLGEELSGYFTLVDAHHNMRRFFTAEHIFPAACFYDITLCSHLRSDDAARIGGAMTAYAVERLIALGLNPLTETLLFKVLEFLKKDLPDFYAEPRLERVLTNMFWASAMCGMSLMTVPNGPVWAIAQVLRTKTKLEYYHALAIMLPFVMEYFLTSSSKKYIGISRIFGVEIQDNSVVEAAIQGIEAIRAMFSSLHLPTRLSEFYITEQQVPDLAKDVMVLSDFAHFPKKLSQDEIESILLSAI